MIAMTALFVASIHVEYDSDTETAQDALASYIGSADITEAFELSYVAVDAQRDEGS